MDLTICISDRQYKNNLQSTNYNRFTSQTTFKAGVPQLKKTAASKKTNSIYSKLKRGFIRTFCKPFKFTIENSCRTIEEFRWPFDYLTYDKKINKIIKMLDNHSKNPEYTEFIKKGLEFLIENKRSKNVKLYSDRILTRSIRGFGFGIGRDSDGFHLITTMQNALRKAIRPKAQIEDEQLQASIEKAIKYMEKIKSSCDENC